MAYARRVSLAIQPKSLRMVKHHLEPSLNAENPFPLVRNSTCRWANCPLYHRSGSNQAPSKGCLTCGYTWSGRRDSNPRPSPWQIDGHRYLLVVLTSIYAGHVGSEPWFLCRSRPRNALHLRPKWHESGTTGRCAYFPPQRWRGSHASKVTRVLTTLRPSRQVSVKKRDCGRRTFRAMAIQRLVSRPTRIHFR